MNVPFIPLDKLKNRPIPQKKQDIIIHFDKDHKDISDDNDNIIIKPKQVIFDKRNDFDINRSEIIERLKQRKAFQVPINKNFKSKRPPIPSDISISNTDTQPIVIDKTNDKITIKDIADPINPNTLKNIPETNDPPPPPSTEPSEPQPSTDPTPKPSAPEPQIEPPKDQQPKKRGRRKKTDDKIIIKNQNFDEFVINDHKVNERLPKLEKLALKTSPYYLHNRKIFMQKINELFRNYFDEVKKDKTRVTCDTMDSTNTNTKFELLTHQRVIRDYFNLYTPYRGLLLFHGLGSGKTCSSIALAEGMKNDKKVYILTPASLKMNFFSELKKCGDELYKKNQFWEFVSIEGKSEYVSVLSQTLNLSTDFIRNNGGAWMINIKNDPNFSSLSPTDQFNIDLQLNEMIRAKYKDMNYNGINQKQLDIESFGGKKNPFDNSVVIIDEAHNFVSRIVNKLKKPKSIPYQLYNFLLNASNCRVVLLTGTPIINYPNEIGILFNILRGYIKTFIFTINSTNKRINNDIILKMFNDSNFRLFDFLDYKDNKLVITRNPFGFINQKKRGAPKGTQKRKLKAGYNKTKKGGGEDFDKYNGIKLDNTGNISDDDFVSTIIRILKRNNVDVQEGNIHIDNNKALPDDKDEFITLFGDSNSGGLKNIDLFQKRILGLTSYFRSAQEQLLPSIVKSDDNLDYHIVLSEMSEHQFSVYQKIRKIEADQERNAKKHKKKNADDDDISSTYKIFSRLACNFAFPDTIERPVPPKNKRNLDDDITTLPNQQPPVEYNNFFDNELDNDVDLGKDNNNESNSEEIISYNKQIEKTLQLISAVNQDGDSEFLSISALPTYSPKFLKVLQNITNDDNTGLHLLYSQFRTIEGIGMMRLILLANGFSEFKLKKTSDGYDIDHFDTDPGKPRFVLYTGTETTEVKELIRNIYNSNWNLVPTNIVTKLLTKNDNNYYGEIIKLFMITSSGAEGINLTNTRFVHIVEPYWHMVRIQQVIGRARRICSHKLLPPELRNVKVFLYMSSLNPDQLASDKHIELRDRDGNFTTDQSLYNIAINKDQFNQQVLHAIKETAIDCELYSNKDNDIACYGFGKVQSNNFSSYPNFKKDNINDRILNQDIIEWEAIEYTHSDGNIYALNPDTFELFDLDSYNQSVENNGKTQPRRIGMLIKVGDTYMIR